MTRRRRLFRQDLAAPEILMVPVAHDPLCARIIERAGFRAVGLGGYANSAALLGLPDLEVLGAKEMVDAAWRTVDAVDIPVFTDADNGYGDATNVAWTVRQLERAGVAGLFVEDQPLPKRCGHMNGKRVVPVEEMVAKIRAAVDARSDGEMLIMARTDALAVHGIDDAMARAHRYIDAGADAVFVESPTTEKQLRRIAGEITAARGIPTMANIIPGGATPLLTAGELQGIGFSMVIYPTVASYTIARAVADVVTGLLATGDVSALAADMVDFGQFNELVGLDRIRAKEREYLHGPGGDGRSDSSMVDRLPADPASCPTHGGGGR
ncbi:oxaloacetate decarboxylase [Kitasatospora sp. NPDC089509]|uniref:isocitrate lyase/PEP mutase family protein n=1 Tax=Kitasatospora sp. NPDC089509 TaxID=3364079 RepID=UPI00382A1C2E